jgi:hypothetical protein
LVPHTSRALQVPALRHVRVVAEDVYGEVQKFELRERARE